MLSGTAVKCENVSNTAAVIYCMLKSTVHVCTVLFEIFSVLFDAVPIIDYNYRVQHL